MGLGESSAHQVPTHVTVLPPYDIERHLLPEVHAHLARAAVRMAPFDIHLRGTGTFRPVSPVVFLNVVEGIAECEVLAETAVAGPLVPELRFPYHPHVTIAHGVAEEKMDQALEDWSDLDEVFVAKCFHVYEFDNDSGWLPTRTFDLGFGERR